MMKVKDAMRKISGSTKKKDFVKSISPPSTPITVITMSLDEAVDESSVQSRTKRSTSEPPLISLSSTKKRTNRLVSSASIDETFESRKISYEEIISVRKNSEPLRKSENIIHYLNLDSKGADLSAFFIDARKKSNVIEEHPEKDTLFVPSDRQQKRAVSSKIRRHRRVNASHSYEPNKLLENAIKEGYDDFVKGLITSGQININKLNVGGFAPLHLAVADNQPTIVQILIDHGAFIDILDSTGFTPLDVAVSEGLFECAQILVEYGADQVAILEGQCEARKSRASSFNDAIEST